MQKQLIVVLIKTAQKYFNECLLLVDVCGLIIVPRAFKVFSSLIVLILFELIKKQAPNIATSTAHHK